MILKAFSVYDQKAKVFHKPFFNATHGEAERNFQTAVNDDKTQFYMYPEDFDLYYIGEYDDNKGVFTSLKSPDHVCKAVSVKKDLPLKEAPVQ